MTTEETIEWTYRLNEALAIGRNPKRAEAEANEWRNNIEHETENKRTLRLVRMETRMGDV